MSSADLLDLEAEAPASCRRCRRRRARPPARVRADLEAPREPLGAGPEEAAVDPADEGDAASSEPKRKTTRALRPCGADHLRPAAGGRRCGDDEVIRLRRCRVCRRRRVAVGGRPARRAGLRSPSPPGARASSRSTSASGGSHGGCNGGRRAPAVLRSPPPLRPALRRPHTESNAPTSTALACSAASISVRFGARVPRRASGPRRRPRGARPRRCRRSARRFQ